MSAIVAACSFQLGYDATSTNDVAAALSDRRTLVNEITRKASPADASTLELFI